jgi:hypothetical protein
LYGDGEGQTNLVIGADRSLGICIGGANIKVHDLTVGFGFSPGERYSSQFANGGVIIGGLSGAGTTSNAQVWNVEVNYAIEGFELSDGCADSVVRDSFSHNIGANAFLLAEANYNTNNCGFSRDLAENSADAGFSIDSLSGVNNVNGYCADCTTKNSGASGLEITGGQSIFVRNFRSDSTFGPGIRIVTSTGYDAVTGVQISGATINNAGQASSSLRGGEGNIGPVAGLYIQAQNSLAISNIKIDGLNITGTTTGPYIGTCVLTGGTITNVQIGNRQETGGQVTYGTGQGNGGCWSGGLQSEDYASVTDLQLGDLDQTSGYGSPIYIESTIAGNVGVGNVISNLANTGNVSSSYIVNNQSSSTTMTIGTLLARNNTNALAGDWNCTTCNTIITKPGSTDTVLCGSGSTTSPGSAFATTYTIPANWLGINGQVAVTEDYDAAASASATTPTLVTTISSTGFHSQSAPAATVSTYSITNQYRLTGLLAPGSSSNDVRVSALGGSSSLSGYSTYQTMTTNAAITVTPRLYCGATSSYGLTLRGITVQRLNP